MWMPPLEDSWRGPVEFYELLFGFWTSYPFLVWWWQRVLKTPLPEWRYAMLAFFAAGALYILFEQLARKGVEQWGMHEFCWMALSFVGFPLLIAWRGRVNPPR
jgi:hypothetical protein